MVPIPYHIFPASFNMNCSPRIHFIIPSLGLDRKTTPMSLNNSPHCCSHHTGGGKACNGKHKACETTKVLVCPLITNSTCNPELELGDNRIPTIVKTELRENSSHPVFLLDTRLTGQSQHLRAAQTRCPLFLFFPHFILMVLLATLNLVFSKSPKNYHSAKPSKVA